MAFFSFEGKQVYYETHGEGNPLLLLNGIMMSTMSWKEFVAPLSAQNRLILVDFMDQGKRYSLNGCPYRSGRRGIYIQHGKKYINR